MRRFYQEVSRHDVRPDGKNNMTTEVPYGLCQCGCGEKAPIAKQGDTKRCHVKGEPKRFIAGHHGRVSWTPDLLWSKVNKTETCWLWTGQLDISGYGQILRNGKLFKTHRVAYELLVGPIPEGLTLDHVKDRGCQHRSCCNPAHLESVTNTVNILRGDSIAANNARKTHCKRGHELDGLNNRGQRFCNVCTAEIDRRFREKKAASSLRSCLPVSETPASVEDIGHP